MSKCTIKDCTNQAVARGLCAMHYMRKVRRGDPEAAFKPGRPPKPHAEDPEAAALKREVASLREEVAALERQHASVKAQAQARAATAPAAEQIDQSKEIEALREQLAEAGRANAVLRRELAQAQDSDVANATLRERIKELERQLIAKYKPPLPDKLERPNPQDPEVQMRRWQDKAATLQRQLEFEREKAVRPPSDEIVELQRQLKGARTRIHTLTREKNHLLQQRDADPAIITKADKKKLLKVFHPDAEAGVSAERHKQLTVGFQIFSKLKFKEVDAD